METDGPPDNARPESPLEAGAEEIQPSADVSVDPSVSESTLASSPRVKLCMDCRLAIPADANLCHYCQKHQKLTTRSIFHHWLPTLYLPMAAALFAGLSALSTNIDRKAVEEAVALASEASATAKAVEDNLADAHTLSNEALHTSEDAQRTASAAVAVASEFSNRIQQISDQLTVSDEAISTVSKIAATSQVLANDTIELVKSVGRRAEALEQKLVAFDEKIVDISRRAETLDVAVTDNRQGLDSVRITLADIAKSGGGSGPTQVQLAGYLLERAVLNDRLNIYLQAEFNLGYMWYMQSKQSKQSKGYPLFPPYRLPVQVSWEGVGLRESKDGLHIVDVPHLFSIGKDGKARAVMRNNGVGIPFNQRYQPAYSSGTGCTMPGAVLLYEDDVDVVFAIGIKLVQADGCPSLSDLLEQQKTTIESRN